MNDIWLEIFIIVILTVLNGFFACSEIALISVRKTRITALVKQNNRRAKIIEQLHKEPEKLFATVQIGVSVITILTSVFAGNSLAGQIAASLASARINFVAVHNLTFAFIIVVAGVAFINLIIGELVPKSLGLRYAETLSLLVAYPIWWLSKISFIFVKILNFFSNLILKPFKNSASFTESRLSEEEIRNLMAEGQKAGAIEAQEYSFLENVFDFSDTTVGKVMVPRTQITAINVSSPFGQIIQEAIASGYSRLPVYENTLNNIVGILYTKNLLKIIGMDMAGLKLEEFLVRPYFVPNTMKISEVLQRLKNKKVHMALVTDEHGEIEGLVTLEDLVEEIVGDISDETDEASKNILPQEDGSCLVAGDVSIVDLNSYFSSSLPEDESFSTVSGFILHKLGRFPLEGDKVTYENLEFLVKEKFPRTVKTTIVKKLAN